MPCLISNAVYQRTERINQLTILFLRWKYAKQLQKKKISFPFFKGYLLTSCWHTEGTLRFPVPKTAIHGRFLSGSPPTNMFWTQLQSNTECRTTVTLIHDRTSRLCPISLGPSLLLYLCQHRWCFGNSKGEHNQPVCCLCWCLRLGKDKRNNKALIHNAWEFPCCYLRTLIQSYEPQSDLQSHLLEPQDCLKSAIKS